MKHPQIGDKVRIKFAGLHRVGVVTEVSGAGATKRWVVLSKGVYYPCLELASGKMHRILGYVKDDIDTTGTCTSEQQQIETDSCE